MTIAFRNYAKMTSPINKATPVTKRPVNEATIVILHKKQHWGNLNDTFGEGNVNYVIQKQFAKSLRMMMMMMMMKWRTFLLPGA